MRVVVTGATGFVGRHVVRELEARGVSPVVVSRSGSAKSSLSFPSQVVEFDIAHAPPDAYELLGEPHAVIHLAWGGLPNYKAPSHINEELPAHKSFLDGLLAAGLGNLTVAGTCLEYGMVSGALSEDMPTAPVTAYGKAKDLLREDLERLRQLHRYNLTWARLFYLYGDGQSKGSLLPRLETAIERGDRTFDMSGGQQLRDYLPVGEAARYLVALALGERDHGIVNVCSGSPISVRELAEGAVKRHQSSIELNFGYFPYPDYEPMAFWGDRSKLQRCLESIDETV
jgi:nucleoside-diphosphate-sugar epimerase